MVENWEDFLNQKPSKKQNPLMEDLHKGIPDRPFVPPCPSDEDRAALYIAREALEKANLAMADSNVGMNKVKEILTVVEDFLVKYEDLKLKLIDVKIELDYLKDKVSSLQISDSQINENTYGIANLTERVAALENS